MTLVYLEGYNTDMKTIEKILEEYPIEFAYLYGSAAKGTERSFSDLDLGLIVEDSLNPEKYLELEIEISTKIDKVLPRVESDVRIFNFAPLNYRIQLVQEGKLIYSKNETRRVDFETQVRSEYFDFYPKRKEYQNAFHEGIKKGGLLWSTRKK